MTREEIIKLLETISAAYPQTKIKDPQKLVDTWEMVLGPYQAGAVYKAARLHISTCQYFPNPADIRKNIIRAELVFNDTQQIAIEAHSKKSFDEEAKEWEPYIDAFCRWIGFGCDPDDSIDLRNFLPYEK